jgi:hypothetical protein
MGDLGSFVDRKLNCQVVNLKWKSPVSGDLRGVKVKKPMKTVNTQFPIS